MNEQEQTDQFEELAGGINAAKDEDFSSSSSEYEVLDINQD